MNARASTGNDAYDTYLAENKSLSDDIEVYISFESTVMREDGSIFTYAVNEETRLLALCYIMIKHGES